MKYALTFVAILSIVFELRGQNQKKIQRSWIKMEIENLSATPVPPDTSYIRYTFAKSNSLKVSFYPGWDTYTLAWSLSGNNLSIFNDVYKIEALTDTSLTIAVEGFRRMKFLAEDYLTNQSKYLDSVREYNGKPLYHANKVITPRYTGKAPLRELIEKKVEGYNIKKASYFVASFIVTETGKVEDVKVIQGITGGFDNEITSQLIKTSNDWRPAIFEGKPIQTIMFYEIKYLNSITPFSSGGLN